MSNETDERGMSNRRWTQVGLLCYLSLTTIAVVAAMSILWLGRGIERVADAHEAEVRQGYAIRASVQWDGNVGRQVLTSVQPETRSLREWNEHLFEAVAVSQGFNDPNRSGEVTRDE